jgi:AmpE protein
VHFLIILIAIAVLESNGQLAFIQRDIWVRKWHGALAKLSNTKLSSSKLSSLENSSLLIVLAYVLVPVILLQLVLWYLGSGILVFLVELSVLLYCLGRGDLSAQIDVLQSDIQRNDLQAAFHDAAVFNIGHRAASADSAKGLFRELAATLPYRLFERSFVVVFWFFFLGAPLALAYRLLALHGDMQLGAAALQVEQDKEQNEELDEEQMQGSEEDTAEPIETVTANNANKLLWYLEWIPVRFLALTLGLMGDFSKATAPLKELVFCPKTSTADVLRLCVLGALNNQSATAEDTAEETTKETTKETADETAALSQVADIVALFRRSMTGWLVAIALLVLTS